MIDPIIEFYYIFSNNIKKDVIDEYMKKCWDISPKKTIAIVFNGRDRINGKKQKYISNNAMIWLRNNKPLTYKANIINYIEKYGCWKDIMYINFSKKVKNILSYNYELNIIAERLKEDKYFLDNSYNDKISLCAKWAPSENDKYDKRRKSARKIASILFPDNQLNLMEKYRKIFITPLRNELKIIEKIICDNKWDEIIYENVPYIARKKLHNSFIKHDKERYNLFLENKIQKINKLDEIIPHHLVKYYIDLSLNNFNDNSKYEVNETIELQWKKIVENIKKEGFLEGIIPIVDLSKSMFYAINGSIPAEVTIALSILILECSKEPFKNMLIPFSKKPYFFYLTGNTLFEKINNIKNIESDPDIDFEEISKLIINYAKTFNISNEDMPKKIICFSDMVINKAFNKYNDILSFNNNIKNDYIKNNYINPSFIYWNLNNKNKNMPFISDDISIINGFSEKIVKIFLKKNNITLDLIIDEILNSYINDIYIDQNEYIKNNEEEINYNTVHDLMSVNEETVYYSDMPDLIPIDEEEVDYSDMPDLIPINEEDYSEYNISPYIQSIIFNRYSRRHQ